MKTATETAGDKDRRYMARALELARQGVGLTSPNPCVGAVVVSASGENVGEGTHTYEGRKHAEVIALEQAADAARSATLYLNLEPCSHTGRTGPCADAVVRTGIARVVVSMQDPNPVVAGNGFRRLREAGIEVSVGLYEQQARRLNEAFAKYVRTKLPFVTLKTAMTLDGKIAPGPGESQSPSALGASSTARGWITSEVARAHVHELRHESDAILVGVGTVIADDPLLTDRSCRPRRRPLVRVILDSSLRIPVQSRVVQSCHDDVVVFCARCEQSKIDELKAKSLRVERVEFDASGRPDLSQVLARLGEMEITSVLLEGGATVNAQAIASGIVDKVFLYYAPKILGGTGAVPFVAGNTVQKLEDALRVKITEIHRFGEDFAVEGYVRDPYE